MTNQLRITLVCAMIAPMLFAGVVFVDRTARAEGNMPAPQPAEMTFVRITDDPVVSGGGMSRGVAWGDYDGDGYADLFVANSDNQRNVLYHNNGDGTFMLVMDSAIGQHEANSESGNWVDYDNDGDLDLFVTNIGDQANMLFRNDGTGEFVQITAGEIVTETRASTGSCWADYDNDGDLDVFVANRDGQDNSFFVNDGNGSFARLTTGEIVTDGGNSRACGWADVDGDNDLDLYVGNAHEPNFFYTNNGDGTFARVTTGRFVTSSAYTYGLSWADLNNNGYVDLFVANLQAANEVYLNDGAGNFARVTDDVVAMNYGPTKGNTWGDFDNDGDLDLYVANGTPDSNVQNYLYLNDGQGRFEVVPHGDMVRDNNISAGTAWADYDNDGDLDLYVANWRDNDEDNALYRNDTATPYGWIKVALVGTQSNRLGIGATVTVQATIGGQPGAQVRQMVGNTGYGSQNEPVLHVGLGDATRVDRIEVRWPSGVVEVYVELPVNTTFVVTEGEGIVPQ